MTRGADGCGWAVQPVYQSCDEAVLSIPLQTLLLKPLSVMDHLEWVGLDRGERGDGA